MSRRQWKPSVEHLARQARIDAVLARRRSFAVPEASPAGLRFAADYAKANLLTYLYEALDAPAADVEVVDSGYDVSTWGRRANETNRERTRRGVSLSGLDQDWCRKHDRFRAPGTLGDLFDAPTGDTLPTYQSGSGLAAGTWEQEWSDRYLLDGLEHAHTCADLVLAGDVGTLELLAGVPYDDAFTDPGLVFDDVPNQLLSLATDAFRARLEDHELVFDPEQTVDMTAPLSALPAMLLAARLDWDHTERLALILAGLTPIGRSSLADI
ncbi:hypothetical protein [Actinoplanes sp. NPDC049802]|uniref:hypothetical protein n=1 Tax=Actinoplanes sp. NPDC049802 TaxID=3154742 RepID=UPI0033F71B74